MKGVVNNEVSWEGKRKMSTISAAQAITEVLKAEGVRFVFGLPGGHTLGIYDALAATPEIRHILVRHEQVAANMAAAYAMLTGEPGVCCATAGPGATNLVTGVAEAFAGALPMIVITGRVSTQHVHRGACQDIPQDRIFAPITKWATRVDRADCMVRILRQAFTVARSGKPGPVLIDIPADVPMEQIHYDRYMPVGKPAAPRGNAQSIREAVTKLLRSDRPVIIAGGGTVASEAFGELRELAETLGVPVLTTLSGRGSFPEDHSLAGGGLGLHRTSVGRKLLSEADFVLGLGCRFEEMETNWTSAYVCAPDSYYVQVDIDPEEMGRSIIPCAGIVGDIRMVLSDMLTEVRAQGGRDCRGSGGDLPRVKELRELKEQLEIDIGRAAATDEIPLSPLRVIWDIRNVLPRETVIAFDIGCLAQGVAGAFPYLRICEPRSCIPPTSFYAMGFTPSGLPAARLVYPDRPAVAFTGDGAFQMIMNVLPVAAEYRLAVTWCILNSNSLGSIKRFQEAFFKGRYIATSFEVQPDFARIAQACQCYGEKVEDPDQITAAFRRAMEKNAQGIPAVLDFIVGWQEMDSFAEFFGWPCT